MTNVYESKPWLANYDADTPPNVDIEHVDALAMFRASLERDRTAPPIISTSTGPSALPSSTRCRMRLP